MSPVWSVASVSFNSRSGPLAFFCCSALAIDLLSLGVVYNKHVTENTFLRHVYRFNWRLHLLLGCREIYTSS